MPKCPACGGIGALLGSLGLLKWFRCINCGIDFNRKVFSLPAVTVFSKEHR